MIWDILETKLIDTGEFTPGQSLFRHSMPAEVVVGVMLRAPLSGVLVDPNIPGFYKPEIQAIIRHHDPVDGEALALLASEALTVAGPENYPAVAGIRGAVKISVFYPKALPIQYPTLNGNGYEWSLNFVSGFSIQPL